MEDRVFLVFGLGSPPLRGARHERSAGGICRFDSALADGGRREVGRNSPPVAIHNRRIASPNAAPGDGPALHSPTSRTSVRSRRSSEGESQINWSGSCCAWQRGQSQILSQRRARRLGCGILSRSRRAAISLGVGVSVHRAISISASVSVARSFVSVSMPASYTPAPLSR